MPSFLTFHLFSQETGCQFGQPLICLLQRCVIFPQQKHDAAHQIALGQDRRYSTQLVFVSPVSSKDGGVPGFIQVIAPKPAANTKQLKL